MATAATRLDRRRSDRLFYSACSALVGLIILTGFARSWFFGRWFAPPPGTPRISVLLAMHGVLLSTWIGFTVVQPALIAGGNVHLHRRLGWAAGATALLAVIVANAAAIPAMHIGFAGLGDPAAFYAIPFFDIQTFAILVALAFWFRKRSELHKRLILLSSTQLMEPALGRIPLAVIQDNFPHSSLLACNWVIFAGIGYDLWSRGRVHPAWLWGGGFVVASEVLRLSIWHSGAWLGFAHWAASLWWG